MKKKEQTQPNDKQADKENIIKQSIVVNCLKANLFQAAYVYMDNLIKAYKTFQEEEKYLKETDFIVKILLNPFIILLEKGLDEEFLAYFYELSDSDQQMIQNLPELKFSATKCIAHLMEMEEDRTDDIEILSELFNIEYLGESTEADGEEDGAIIVKEIETI